MSITVAWDPSPDADITGYKLYCGPGSHTYDRTNFVGAATTLTITNLEEGRSYWFAVAAVNSSGMESIPTDEVTLKVNSSPSLVSVGSNPWSSADSIPVVALFTGVSAGLPLTALDPDVPGQTLTFSLVSGPPGATVDSSGQFRWTPPSSAVGTNLVTVRVSDNGVPAFGDTRTFAVVVSPAPNRPPVAAPDLVDAVPDQTTRVPVAFLLRNDADPDGDKLQVVSADPRTQQGGAVVVSEGFLYYTPPAGFQGSDGLFYRITDGNGNFSSAGITVRVQAPVKAHITPVSTLSEGGAGVLVAFQTAPNLRFAVEASGDLSTWIVLGSAVSDKSGTVTYLDSNAPPTSRFYRLSLP